MRNDNKKQYTSVPFLSGIYFPVDYPLSVFDPPPLPMGIVCLRLQQTVVTGIYPSSPYMCTFFYRLVCFSPVFYVVFE